MRWLAILMLWVLAAPAIGQTVAISPAAQPAPPMAPTTAAPLPPPPRLPPVRANSADGRYFGHLPYGETPAKLLTTISQPLPVNRPCEVHRDAAPALYRLMFAAQSEGISLRAVSCFRGIQKQTDLFCAGGAIGACTDPGERSRSVAPGGFSEHATGYVVDFSTPGPAGCNDLFPCMAGTPGGLWLAANGPKYGFELSFPPTNKQGVTWEPWHWRWVGVTGEEPGAKVARALFSRARAQYPAKPGIGDAGAKLKPVDRNRFVGPRD